MSDRLRIFLHRAQGLRRFKRMQEWTGTAASVELARGRKTSHWMWWIFPQARGLGQSYNSRVFGLTQREAKRYVNDAELRDRLHRACWLVVSHTKDKSLEEIFGELDAKKFRSCMELFAPLDPTIAHVWLTILRQDKRRSAA